MTSKKNRSADSPESRDEWFAEWLAPLSDDAPCGPDLEYDPEFVVLMAKTAPRTEAQYGDFIGTPEAINWTDVERECRQLLTRTRDLRIAILLLRARVRLGAAQALLENLTGLTALLDRYPDHVHPQLVVDGERDPGVRANALAALADPEGLLGDIREISLGGATARRLQVRDVERAFSIPTPADALSPESVRRQLEDLRMQRSPELLALAAVRPRVEHIRVLSDASLGHDAPDIGALVRLVAHFAVVGEALHRAPTLEPAPTGTAADFANPESVDGSESCSGDTPANSIADAGASFSAGPGGRIRDRADALDTIRQTRNWFETHEPSSPVADLLRQAEKLVGKRFSEVAQSVPIDLLQKWAEQA
ncbi:type VI secretion system protein TssA [Burkholderia pyrrocinia]|uniref:type VI secretion system protein TssA n=1 Tax=Burkholderia pyrrocinia TaxID=60550 RepID=UPI001BCF4A0A|nr:type VI secretion system protein TssA [Burkholderia pyrrocinia]QVN23846.1 type VI secretion system protein TssA [Burkholderia pyrrocinia]